MEKFIVKLKIVFILLVSNLIFAQPPFPGGGGGNGPEAPAQPIDSYQIILLVLGVVLAVYYTTRKQIKKI